MENQNELPMIWGIDWEYAKLHFHDEKALWETARFCQQMMKSDMEELQYYFRESKIDLVNYRIKVHSMKNSVMTIGILPLVGVAMLLEEAARKENWERILVLHPIFVEKWQKYEELLKENLPKEDSVSKSLDAKDFEFVVEGIFAQIRDAARELDIDTLDEMSAVLDKYTFEGERAEKVKKIKGYICNFDVEKLMEM